MIIDYFFSHFALVFMHTELMYKKGNVIITIIIDFALYLFPWQMFTSLRDKNSKRFILFSLICVGSHVYHL